VLGTVMRLSFNFFRHSQGLPDPEGFGKQKAEPERATDTEGEVVH